METPNSPTGGPQFQTEPGQKTKIIVSRPDEIVRHEIADEELEMLSNLRRDWTMEAFWGFAGATIGAFKGAVSAILSAYGGDKVSPMPWGDLIEVLIFCGCFVAGGILLIVSVSRSSRASDLVKTIRDRKKTSDVEG